MRLSILRCFFLRMRLRRFLISDPMTGGRLTACWPVAPVRPGRWETSLQKVSTVRPLRSVTQTQCPVVQLAERLTLDQEVGGSSPPRTATTVRDAVVTPRLSHRGCVISGRLVDDA